MFFVSNEELKRQNCWGTMIDYFINDEFIQHLIINL